nr:oxidoreductase C-terminal domain-containing protein [Mycobacterium pseudoshottsii]
MTDNIFVAGDVARAPHVLYEYEFMSQEHWDNAVFGAEVAANNMISLEMGRRPHLPLPSFWSGQFGVNVKSVGVCSFGDEIVFTQGSIEQRRFAAAYGYRGRIVGAVTFDHGKWLPYYASLIEQSAPPSRRPRRAMTAPSVASRCRPGSRTHANRPQCPMWC